MIGDKCKREKLLGLVMSAFNRQALVSDMFKMQPKYLGFEAEPNPAEFDVAQDGNIASDCKFTSGPILKPHSLMTMVTSTISTRISRLMAEATGAKRRRHILKVCIDRGPAVQRLCIDYQCYLRKVEILADIITDAGRFR
jgi:hypothetical protein